MAQFYHSREMPGFYTNLPASLENKMETYSKGTKRGIGQPGTNRELVLVIACMVVAGIENTGDEYLYLQFFEQIVRDTGCKVKLAARFRVSRLK